MPPLLLLCPTGRSYLFANPKEALGAFSWCLESYSGCFCGHDGHKALLLQLIYIAISTFRHIYIILGLYHI